MNAARQWVCPHILDYQDTDIFQPYAYNPATEIMVSYDDAKVCT